MDKKTKSISISTDVCQEIDRLSKECGFIFSHWIESKFRNDFLSIEKKEEEINLLNQKITNLRKEILEVKTRKETYSKIFSNKEEKWLLRTDFMIKQGSTIIGLNEVFNKSFNKNLSFKEFSEAIKYFKYNDQ